MFLKNRDFAEAYNDYYPVVFNIVYSKIKNIDDTEDLCQEIFIRFYHKLDSIENRKNWLMGALKNVVKEYYRRKKENTVDIDTLFDDENLGFVNGLRDARIILNEALDNMDNFKDEREKTLFELVAIQKYTYEEAGVELGFTRRQVRYRYEQIINRLIGYLKNKGIEDIGDLV